MASFAKTLPRRTSPSMTVPFFALYGQEPREIDSRFVHVERVRDRAALHHGHVRPHRHPHLHQISLWIGGHGAYFFEGEAHPLPPAALSLMPAGAVHGFDIEESADAIVVSISDDFRRECLQGSAASLEDVLSRPALLDVDAATAERLLRLFQDIESEYRFGGWGQADAIAAYLKLVLIAAARAADLAKPVRAGPRTELLARFGALLDAHFVDRWTVERYASELATTPYLLNAATRSSLDLSVGDVMKQRAIREAKRLLIYTALSVVDVGLLVGYDDPAHFTRFFRARVGQSPAVWRRTALSAIDNARVGSAVSDRAYS